MYEDTDIQLKGKMKKVFSSPMAKQLWPFSLCHAYCHCFRHCIVLSFHCPDEVNVTIHWLLKYYPCHNEFNNIEVSEEASCNISSDIRL